MVGTKGHLVLGPDVPRESGILDVFTPGQGVHTQYAGSIGFPDLSHAGTRGEILKQIRERVGDPYAYVDPQRGWHVCFSPSRPLHWHHQEVYGVTEGKCLEETLILLRGFEAPQS